MGDDAWLKRSQVEYRRFVYYSDIVRFKGSIVKKYIDSAGEYCVDIDVHAINQRQEEVMPGHATIALPSREKNISPLDGRLRQDRNSLL